MGKTTRREPSSGMYLKQQSHVNRRKLEENAKDSLEDFPHYKHNRIASAKSRIANPWDDTTITYYRGQEWHRKR